MDVENILAAESASEEDDEVNVEDILEESDLDDQQASETLGIPGLLAESADDIRVPTRVNCLTSYTSIGNREITAPLHEIRAKFREKSSGKNNGKESSKGSLGELQTRSDSGELQTLSDEESDALSHLQMAQVVGLDILDNISAQLERNAQYQDQGPGLPTSISVHPRFIAVGTSRSLIIIFDNSQTISRVICKGKTFDRLDAACRFAVASDTNFGPVSAMDIAFSGVSNNEILVVGYARGRIELWDLSKGSNLKSVQSGQGSHSCAISCIRFVGTGGPRSNLYETNGSSKKPFASVVSVDTSGVVNMLVFHKTLMLFSVELKCLLDGGAGQIVSMAACEDLNMVAISSRKDTFLVSLDDATAKIVYRWPLVDEGSLSPSDNVLPRLSWGNAKMDDDSNTTKKIPFILARGMGSKIEFLKTAIHLSRDRKKEYNAIPLVNKFLSATKGKHSSVFSVEWLNDSLLAFLNSDFDMCILDISGMAIVEQINVKNVEIVWTAFGSESLSFQNSIRASRSTLYLLGMRQLSVAKVQTWTQRVETLILHNGWMEALALSLDHFHLTGQREKSKVADLIIRFATTQVVQADSFHSTCDDWDRTICSACIEYCVEIDRTDLLFDTIYDIFAQAGKRSVFLTLLEPFILNRLLVSVRPSVLQDFVEEYVSQGKIAELEQCILHLSPDTIRTDLHTLVGICTEQKLYSGIVYLYNAGLNDYDTPAKILLEMGETEKLLAYIETSFRGLTYPFGFAMDESTGFEFIRVDLLGFLLDNLKAVAKRLLEDANDIKDLSGLLDLGLGNHFDDWEVRAIEAISGLDPSEALQLCAKRLQDHPIKGLKDRSIVDAVLQRTIADGVEQNLCSILRNCNPSLYDVGHLTEQIQAFGWNKALTTLHEIALSSAIEDGQDLVWIRNVFEQILRVSETPAQFILQQLSEHSGKIIVRQALEDAFSSNLNVLSRCNSDELEKMAAVKVITLLVSDPSMLDEFPELQFSYMKNNLPELLQSSQDQSDLHSLEGDVGEPKLVHKYIHLLCRFEPQNVLSFLSDNDGVFSVEEALANCRKFNVRDATAYLLERTGNSRGAVEMILATLRETECPEFERSRLIVNSAVQLCERNSRTDLDSDHAESLWFLVLDEIVQLVTKEEFHATLLRNLLDIMMEHIESEKILTNLNTQNYGQLRHTIKCMIDARAYDKRMLTAAKNVAAQDLIHKVRSKHDSLARGSRLAVNDIWKSVISSKSSSAAPSNRRKKFSDRRVLSWETQMKNLLPKPLNIDP